MPVAHIESGLRSGDWSMPEEQNRVLTDRLSDFLFTHSPEANENLVAEGIPADRIHYVGNTMIDTLRRLERDARERQAWAGLGADEGGYALVTLHRPSNVDVEDRLRGIVTALAELGRRMRVVFPIHPRTRARLASGEGLDRLERAGVICLDPLGYLDFLSLQCAAGLIVTDSGGVQEEAAALGVPCYTLRASTERPITITQGTNTLIGEDPAAIGDIELAVGARPPGHPPLGRQGRRARRRRPRLGPGVVPRAGRLERLMTSGSEILVLPHSSTPRDRARVVGCDIDRLDMDQTVRRCAEIIESGGPAQHVAVNVAKVVALRENLRLREIVERCELVSVDGQPLVWVSRLLGDPLPERVTGIDLMFRLLELAQERSYRVYVLGAKEDVLATAIERLGELYPGLVVAGSHHGYFADEKSVEISALIREAEPHILLVAMTSPRKEYWLAEHAADLGVPFSMGVGGSIDIVAGVTKRAPASMQRLGLEWFYRFVQEPRRLGPRYLRTNLRFAGLLARELVSGRRRPR